MSGMVWSNAHQVLKSVEASLAQQHVLGTGLNHVVSKQHLDLRRSAFNYQHRQHAAALLHNASTDAASPVYVSLPLLQPTASLSLASLHLFAAIDRNTLPSVL